MFLSKAILTVQLPMTHFLVLMSNNTDKKEKKRKEKKRKERRKKARQGKARQGKARRGEARRGETGQNKQTNKQKEQK